MRNDELMIIQRAKNGDPLAFARLHDTYFPLIYRFFYYRIKDTDLIGELSAGVFSRMVERIQTYKVESMNFLPWLYMLAKSQMMETLLERGQPYKDTAYTIIQTDINQAMSADLIKSMLFQLPYEERDVLIGRLIERRATRDIAREIGRSVPAVKALQRQGLRHLRSILPSEN